MIVDGLDFYDREDLDPAEVRPTSPEECLRIVRSVSHMVANGSLPTEKNLVLSVLFAAVAKLALGCDKSLEIVKAQQSDPDEIERIVAIANESMAGLVAAACMWADAIPQSSNAAYYGS